MLRIGVIGCGRIAQDAHLPVLARLSGVAVTALADPDPQQRELAQQFAPAAQSFAEGGELLDNAALDAVVIASPPDLHARLAADAIARSLHVYLEKPIATTLAQAAMLLDTWKRASVAAMAGFNYRYHPLYQEARHLLLGGAIGKPLAVSSMFTSSAPVSGTWRSRRSAGGGALLELGSHHIDMVHYLFGETALEVKAQMSQALGEGASATLQMQLASGLLVSSLFSFGTVDEDRFEIYGDQGSLRINRHLATRCQLIPARNQRARLRQIRASFDFLSRPGALLEKQRSASHEPSYARALRAFVDSIRTGEPGYPNLSDGFRALSAIIAAEESAKTGSSARVFANGGML